MRKPITIIILLFFGVCNAKDHIVVGSIWDYQDSSPINASITLYNCDGTQAMDRYGNPLVTHTRNGYAEGWFAFSTESVLGNDIKAIGDPIVPEGTYKAVFNAEGYRMRSVKVHVKGDEVFPLRTWMRSWKDIEKQVEENFGKGGVYIPIGYKSTIEFISYNDTDNVFLNIPESTFTDNSRFYITEYCDQHPTVTYDNFTIQTLPKYFDLWIRDRYGNMVHNFPHSIEIGWGKSYIDPTGTIHPYPEIDVLFLCNDGRWIEAKLITHYPGLLACIETNHLSSWLQENKPKRIKGVSIHGGGNVWYWREVWRHSTKPEWKPVKIIEFINGKALGGGSCGETQNVEQELCDAEEISNEMKIQAGGETEVSFSVADVKAWVEASGSQSKTTSKDNRVLVTTGTTGETTIPEDKDLGDNSNGYGVIYRETYKYWLVFRLWKTVGNGASNLIYEKKTKEIEVNLSDFIKWETDCPVNIGKMGPGKKPKK